VGRKKTRLFRHSRDQNRLINSEEDMTSTEDDTDSRDGAGDNDHFS